MSYKLELSTKPAKALGDDALWDVAEASLTAALNTFAGEGNWRVNPGDGAFYGPKIDIKVFDAMERVHQCATVQLDFQLPIRFDLNYRGDAQVEATATTAPTAAAASEQSNSDAMDVDTDGNTIAAAAAVKPKGVSKNRPVMVHRAMLGSLERMIAVLTEHYGGRWPFWLSPRQAMVVPVGQGFIDYAMQVRDKLHAEGFYVDVDDSTKTLNKKVREAETAHYNFVLVVGAAERDTDEVNCRETGNKEVQARNMKLLPRIHRYKIEEGTTSTASSSTDSLILCTLHYADVASF
eukprot:17248-Heterococcus_DN1.PRE.1